MSEAASNTAARESSLAWLNGLKLTLSLVAMLVVAMAVRVWLPRVLGPDGYGQLHFAESLAMGLFLFTTFGADVYIRKEVAVRPAHASEFFGGLLLARLAMSVVMFGAMGGVLMWMGKLEDAWWLAFLFGVGQVGFVLETTLSAVLHATGTVNALSLLSAGSKIIWGVAIVVGVGLGGGPEIVAVAFAVTEWGKAIALFLLVKRVTPLSLRVDVPATLSMLLASLPFFLHFLSHRLYERIDVQMLSVMTTDSEVGWYGASVNIATVGMVFLPVLSAVLLPMGARVAHESIERLNEMMRGAIRAIVVFGGLSALLLSLHAADIANLAFGEGFAPSVTSLRLLAPLFPLTYVAVVAGAHLLQLGRIWTVTKISVAGLLLNPTMNFFTIPWGVQAFGEGGGGAGAAVATLVTEIWASGAMLVVLGSAALDRRLMHTALRVVAMCAVTAAFHTAFSSLGLWRLAIDAWVYLACGVVLGAIPLRETAARVRRVLLRR